MILSVATFSLEQAHNALRRGGLRKKHPYAGLRRAWVGFESPGGPGDVSPLRSAFDGASIVVQCIDWDVDGRHSPAIYGKTNLKQAPSMEIAKQLVDFVMDLHRAAEEYVLIAHCHKGRYRSGSIAEFCRADLDVEEAAFSKRLENTIGDTPEQRTHNIALLRLMRDARREQYT